MDERLQSLDRIEAAVWQQLTAAATDRQHAWRTPVLATIEGDLADARTIVLRDVEAAERRLLFYSDARAAKVAQLAKHPVGTLVMWSEPLGWQLRCRVHLTVEAPGLATSSRWARIKLSPAAQDYLSPLPPGAPLAATEAPAHAGVTRNHFAVIGAQVLSIDWLELHAQGHRRARFDGEGATWLQP